MVNWFPLRRGLIESPEFAAMTPAEKVYFLYLVSESNLATLQGRNSFYKSDLEVAVTIGLSEDKVRRVRRKFARIAWISVRPGFRSQGRNMATTYLSIKWASTPKEGDGDWFAPLHRFAFAVLLAEVREGTLRHADLVVYTTLCYVAWKNRGEGSGRFFATKRDLVNLTGVPGAAKCVSRLHQRFHFSNGTDLFNYQDDYHRLTFTKWSGFLDPSESEKSLTVAKGFVEEVKRRLRLLKMTSDELPEYYLERSKTSVISAQDRAWLIELGNDLTIKQVLQTMDEFLGKYHRSTTLRSFRKWYGEQPRG